MVPRCRLAPYVWPSIAAAFATAFGIAEHRAIRHRCHPTATDDISRIPHIVPAIVLTGVGATSWFAIHIRNHIRWRNTQ